MTDIDLDALADDLSDFAAPDKKQGLTPREERVIAGFEDIQRFVAEHGRNPQHGEDRDIFERLYAVRLDRLRVLSEYQELLAPLDHQGLLAETVAVAKPEESEYEADVLAAELAELDDSDDDIHVLRHVRTTVEKRTAEEIANRQRCEDFDQFKSLFERVQTDIQTGLRQSQPITAGNRAIEAGDFFVLNGITLYVAEVGEPLKTTAGEVDSRLRVIFANGTESNLLLRSLQRAFYDDPTARRLVSPQSGQLAFADFEAGDVETGTIYVLRSLSDAPYVAENRELIHKIGVTGSAVETRIANAEHDATYLLAKVEVVATYKLSGINRNRMERLFHRLFAPAKLDITIHDRFGKPVQPREWFLVPLFVIEEAVERIRDGSITRYVYDPKAAALVEVG